MVINMIKLASNKSFNYCKAIFWPGYVIERNITPLHKYKLSYLSILSITLLSACAQTAEKTSAMPVEASTQGSITVSKDDSETYEHGLIALNNNDDAKAEKIFNGFLEDKPELAGPYTNLALIYFKKKEYEKSLQFVNKALQRDPKQAQAYQLRAQIFVTQRKINDAKNDYLHAIELKPDYINAQYNLALLYDIYLQEIALAIKHYEIYLSLIKKPDVQTKEWMQHLKGTLANG